MLLKNRKSLQKKNPVELNGPYSASLQALHRTIGNQAIIGLLKGEILISSPDAFEEREAERQSQDIENIFRSPGVCLHTDKIAAQAAESIGAQAFTLDVKDSYDPLE